MLKRFRWSIYQRSFLSLFLIAMIVVSMVAAIVVSIQVDQLKDKQQRQISYTAKLTTDMVNAALSQAIRDTKLLARNVALLSEQAAPTAHDSATTWQPMMVQSWRDMSNATVHYDQIRWLDNTGMERIRVNYSPDGAYAVPQADLQNKADRYYFKAGMALALDKVYLSPLDLNIEHKQIETPYKPTIRIVAPVIDSNGQRHGMIVINYLADQFLNAIENSSNEQVSLWLLNEAGYWLANKDQQMKWGFMFKQHEHTLSQQYPEIATRIQHPSQEHDDLSLLAIHKILPVENNRIASQNKVGSGLAYAQQAADIAHDNYWWLIAFVPEDKMFDLIVEELETSTVALIVLVLMALFSSHLFARYMTLEQQQLDHVKRLNQQLSEENARYEQAQHELKLAASVFTHANEGIMITDANSIILDVNHECCRITGYSREELIGSNPKMLSSGKYDQSFYNKMKNDLKQKGHWYGELWNRRKTGEPFAEFLTISSVDDDDGVIHHYVGLFTDITVEKQYQKQLERMAHYDALTDLPNRVLLIDRMQQSIVHSNRLHTEMAVIFLDLDGFKGVNDECGHEKGDEVLIEVAQTLQKYVRGTDTVSRLGGDEFVIVMSGMRDRAATFEVMDKLMLAIERDVECNGKHHLLSASLGVTFYPQPQPVSPEQLIRQADQAMYYAKQAGKNIYHVFDVTQDQEATSIHLMLHDIEHGIANDTFTIHYQPKVSLATGALLGLEALIRWNHPEKGLLYPCSFLDATAMNQVSILLSEWVIRRVLLDRKMWNDSALAVPVSVNLGSMELQQGNFIDWLLSMIASVPNARPDWIEVELLETQALSDLEHVSRLLHQLQNLGIKVSLDDFGTGYSSLSYLKYLSLNYIKIDQSFIRQMFDDKQSISMIDGVLGIIKALNHTSIAEGIETEAHGVQLLRMGCGIGQGYFIAKPMPATKLNNWLASWTVPAAWAAAA